MGAIKKKEKSLQQVEESQAEAECNAAQMSLPKRHPATAQGSFYHNMHISDLHCKTCIAIYSYTHMFPKFKPCFYTLTTFWHS